MYCCSVEHRTINGVDDDMKNERRFTQHELTLIQGWFINWAMVILSLGSVFSNCTMSCLATRYQKTIEKLSVIPKFCAAANDGNQNKNKETDPDQNQDSFL